MRYDIVPIQKHYRGMGRLLLATDIYTRRTKNAYTVLLNRYYEYLSYVQQYPSKAGLTNLISFCNELEINQIMCEVIVYDINPLKTAFDYDLEFLGFDIVYEMSESLICECSDSTVKKFLNNNGLCSSETDVNSVIQLLDNDDIKWEPCYIYKVLY